MMTIEVFPSFLELFAYAELVTSGLGRILPFIDEVCRQDRSTIESEGNSISLFLRYRYRHCCLSILDIDQTSQPVSSFTDRVFHHLRTAFYFHLIIDECLSIMNVCRRKNDKVVSLCRLKIKVNENLSSL